MSLLSFLKYNSNEKIRKQLTDKVNAKLQSVEKKHETGFQRVNTLLQNYQNSKLPIYAGQTTFFLILSSFPFLLFFFSLLKLTPLSEGDFLYWAEHLIPHSLSDTLTALTNEIYAQSNGGTISITILSALWLSSKAFVSLQQGLNVMYRVKETRNYILMRLYGVFYSVILALLLQIVLGIMVFGKKIRKDILPETLFFDQIIDFRLFICVPVLFLFFLLLYIFLPNRKQIAKGQIPGAVFASAAWIIFSYGFSIYVDKFSNYASFYGTMTTIALIMVWLYGCMYMLFLGGLLNRTLEKSGMSRWHNTTF